MADKAFWDFPPRDVATDDKMVVGSATSDTASVPVLDTARGAVATAEVEAAAAPAALVGTTAEADLRRWTPAAVSQAMPLAGEASRGLVTAEERSRLQALDPGRQVPTGGALGQHLAVISDSPMAYGWVTPSGGGGGGGGGISGAINLGTGVGVWRDTQDGLLQLRSLLLNGAAGGFTVTEGGSSITLELNPATSQAAGVMSAADKAKLDGIPPGGGAPPVYSGSVAPGLVPGASTTPPSAFKALHEDGVWRTVSGGTINFGEPPSSPAEDPVAYGRAFVDGAGSWLEAAPLLHGHVMADIENAALDGAAGQPVVVDGSGGLLARPLFTTSDLADISPVQPVDGQLLVYNQTQQSYVPTTPAAASANVPVRPTLATDAELTADFFGSITPINLASGDVTVTIPGGLTHPVGTVQYAQFLVSHSVAAGAALRFSSISTAAAPTLAAHYLGGKGTNVSGTAISNWSTEGADKHTLNCPAGDAQMLVIGVCVQPATIGSSTSITATLNGSSITLDSGFVTEYSYNAGNWRYYVVARGDRATSTTETLRLTGGTNVNCYSVIMACFNNAAQTDNLSDMAHERKSTGTLPVNYSVEANTANSLACYFLNRVQASGGTAPTVDGATLVAWSNVNVGTNRGAATVLLTTEAVTATGTVACDVTWSNTNNSTGLAFIVKGSGISGFQIRVTGNGTPDVSIPNKLVTLLYDNHNSIATVLL